MTGRASSKYLAIVVATSYMWIGLLVPYDTSTRSGKYVMVRETIFSKKYYFRISMTMDPAEFIRNHSNSKGSLERDRKGDDFY